MSERLTQRIAAERHDAEERQERHVVPVHEAASKTNGVATMPRTRLEPICQDAIDEVGRAAERARDGQEDRVDDAAGEGEAGRPAEVRRRRLQRDDHAGEADEDRRPSPPADLLAEEQRREQRHVDRPGEIVGHRVGERQVARRPVEQAGLDAAEQGAHDLQPRAFDADEGAEAGAATIGASTMAAEMLRKSRICGAW